MNYNDPIIFNWRIDKDTGEKFSVPITNEQGTVINNQIFLSEIPDKFHGVTIIGMNERNFISTATDFKVDYTSGAITFHSSKEGQTITVEKYNGLGVIYSPASRIWTKIGNMGQVIETLDGVLSSIASVSSLKDEIDESLTSLSDILGEGNFAENVAEAKRVSATLATQLTNASNQGTQLTNLSATMATQIETMENQNTISATTIENLNGVLASANTTRDFLNTLITSGNNLLGELTTKMGLAEGIINDLTTKSARGSSTTETLHAKIVEAETALDNLNLAISGTELSDYVTIQMLDLRLNNYIRTVNTLAETTDNGIWIVTNE